MRSPTPYFNQNYARHLYARGHGAPGFGRFAKVAIVGTGVYFVSKKLFQYSMACPSSESTIKCGLSYWLLELDGASGGRTIRVRICRLKHLVSGLQVSCNRCFAIIWDRRSMISIVTLTNVWICIVSKTWFDCSFSNQKVSNCQEQTDL
ncbi:hypothetical protein BO83DRAFT_222396 [Aspergillus eucalypticola CBS 122712]|uniref:Uncharacterized protein n=1 Tax=Aspergillus eucalypticola (strain CBS 122712 / IBT 29274) TaxID=1448314 RepID=A0A317VXC0_ASPEC|nr:uncharacterized protein BO83DRAFT_222396 [Aspergillus eucalypticola CBS 122712]PWY77642.1 hypothetical protein BO83DRAFT_222396 [Aspergillus eucalypticola CBS 122712]